MTTTTRPLTLHVLDQLAKIADAAYRNQPITREIDGGSTVTATGRAITRADGTFLGPDDDVRDGYVWVSGMFEHFWPVAELLDGLDDGTVALNYRP